jgi:hypothetical protein
MTSRASTTGTPAAKAATPAKKTAAKKTAARAPRARTPRKTTAAAPALSLVKDSAPNGTAPPKPTTTLVDLRHPLPVRRRLFVGPMGATEQAAVRAALAAASARLPIPVRTWNGSTAQLADGTLLIHNPGPDRLFTAHIACRHGAIHGTPISSLRDLGEARALTHACERPHGGVNANQAITEGVNILRARIALVARWINNPANDRDARRSLAQTLGLPEPGPENSRRAATAAPQDQGIPS